MANEEQIAILRQGAEAWNSWRFQNREQSIELMGANLSGINLAHVKLMGINLRDANFCGADLSHAQLNGAELNEADFSDAKLIDTNMNGAYLFKTNLQRADLTLANLSEATLRLADFRDATLNAADLTHTDLTDAIFRNAKLNNVYLDRAILVGTDFSGANLTGCHIYGISAWDVGLDGAIQTNLVITQSYQPTITVDNIRVAQFIYLLIHNKNIRDVIQTIGNKAVLILGRFADEKRKSILDALREKLRLEGFLPIIFDFEKATNVDFTETVKILAGMCLFIIADITAPKSVPHELQSTVPDYMVPFVPIIEKGEQPYSMFVDLQRKYRDWVMPIYEYETVKQLIEETPAEIIAPAIERHNELIALKNQELKYRKPR